MTAIISFWMQCLSYYSELAFVATLQEMKIAYCTNVRLPSERAHGHQIAEVADALAYLGHRVTVFAPFRRNPVKQPFHEYYHADPRVELRLVGSFDPIASPFLPGVLGLFFLNWRLRSAYMRLSQFDLLYTRAPALFPALLRTGIPTIIELHQLPRRQRGFFVHYCNRAQKVVCLTSAMQKELLAWGVLPQKTMVAGDAVSLERFQSLPNAAEARKRLQIQTHRPIVGYVGRLKTLDMNKGVEELLHATTTLRLSASPVHLLIVGGPERDIDEYRRMAHVLGLTPEDVTFTGSLPAERVPEALIACDVLAMPFPDYPHYRTNMSPLKMFEYMATGLPIITSDLPTIRDVLSERTAFFCTPGDPASLAATITKVLSDPTDSSVRGSAAKLLVQEHTWQKRMEHILSSLA
jgi:glycosyltransferase involved in cell wall biosynthesis